MSKEELMCWDDIEWLRAYIVYVQENHPQIDEYATQSADEKTNREEAERARQ